jgi:hypothetical protein
LALGFFRAWRCDEVEQTLPFDLVQVGLVFLRTLADGCNFVRRRLPALGVGGRGCEQERYETKENCPALRDRPRHHVVVPRSSF